MQSGHWGPKGQDGKLMVNFAYLLSSAASGVAGWLYNSHFLLRGKRKDVRMAWAPQWLSRIEPSFCL